MRLDSPPQQPTAEVIGSPLFSFLPEGLLSPTSRSPEENMVWHECGSTPRRICCTASNSLIPGRTLAIREQLGLKDGDAVFFVLGVPQKFYKFAGEARTKIGNDLNLLDKEQFAFCWIVDFPMYEWNEDEKRVDFSHNPFSMPQGELEALESQDPLTILAWQYDIVCNGIELCSGAIRNHRPDIMYKAFAIAGYSQEEVDSNFSGMINAFKYGAPPHGGAAPGVDRIVMLLCNEPNIREVVLFPMNQRAEDLMMGAPSEATPKQLRELHMRLNLTEKRA